MRSGNLKDKIEIYKQITERTASGATKIEYVLRCTCRAQARYSSGSRAVENDEIFYAVDRDFVVRSYIPIELTDQIHFDGSIWQVLSIDHDKKYNNIYIRTTRINE